MTGIDTDDLYGLPLERFVPERDVLARAIRAEGRREEAAAVARLPRPSVSAWVVNQLVRGHREAVKSLLDAGDSLRDAQAGVIEGRGDGRSLRAAAERERAAVEDLLGAARALSGEGGPALSNTILDRVADTLHAAAFAEEAREQVRAGRLERELRHVGLGALAAGPLAPEKRQPAAKREPSGKAAKAKAVAPGKPAKRGAVAAGKAGKPAEAEARKAAKQAEAEARKAAKQAEAEAREASHAARQTEVQARRRTERAARALTRAEERQVQAAQALSDADQALDDARSEADAAGEALATARSEAESAGKAQREARQRLASP